MFISEAFLAAMLSCPTVQFTVCYAVFFGRIKWWWWWWCSFIDSLHGRRRLRLSKATV